MLIGAHSVIYSTSADADRAFLRDVLKLPNVEAGGGYLIFGLPPAEVAVQRNDDVIEVRFQRIDEGAGSDLGPAVAKVRKHVAETRAAAHMSS